MKNPSTLEGFVGMDLDSSDLAIDASKGSYRFARNMRIYPKGILISMDGTLEVPWDQPLGVNTPVNDVWDSETDSTFIFFHNSLGNHTILRVFADTLAVHVVAQGDVFNFRKESVISGDDYVFQELLQWTDPTNDPRQLDVKRADDTGKKLVLRVFFPLQPNNVDQRVFGAAIIDPQGAAVSVNGSFHVSTSSEVYGFTTMARAWADSFNATFGTWFTATSCGSFVEIEATSTGRWSVVLGYTDTVQGIIEPIKIQLWEYRNTYIHPFSRYQIDRAKFHPSNPPEVSVFNDPVRTDNRIERHVFQFCLRYVFRNGERSVEGPWTEVVAVSPSTYGASTAGNSILVDFSNDINLVDRSALEEVDQLEMLVKDVNGLWKSAIMLEKWEFIYGLTWVFRNDLQMAAYQGSSGGIDEPFPLNLQTWVPQRANAQTLISDPNNQDNIRGMFGGCVEGLPTPCIPADINITYNDTSIISGETCKVRVRVRILNAWPTNAGGDCLRQPITRIDKNAPITFGGMQAGLINDYVDPSLLEQKIPAGGFTVYLAGTQHYGITTQRILMPSSGAITGLVYVPGTTVFDTSTASRRKAVYDLMKSVDGDIWQEVEIIGVKPGQTYLLRIAEHRCSVLNDGSIYDLAGTTFAWQGTSSQTVMVGLNGQAGTTRNFYEARLEIPTGFTGTFDAGWAGVLDCSYPTAIPLSERVVVRQYVRDADGTDYSAAPLFDVRTRGASAEKQLVVLRDNVSVLFGTVPAYLASLGYTLPEALLVGKNAPTDHNGHAFFPCAGKSGKRTAWLSVTGDPLFPIGTFNGWVAGLVNVSGLTICNDGNSPKWQGNLATANPLPGPITGNLTFTQNAAEYIVANIDPNAQGKIRTWVDGSVLDQNGNPLGGIVVIIENGRVGRTDVNGAFSIPIYGDMNENSIIGANFNRRILDGLVFFADGFVNVTFPSLGFTSPPMNIFSFEDGATYSDGVHYLFGVEPAVVPVNATVGGVWPRGWRGAFGIILYDQHGRITPVQKLIDAYIPWPTEDLHRVNPVAYPVGTYITGLPDVNFQMNGAVPTPAYGRFVRYQFVATENTLHSFMLQWAIPSVDYISAWDEGTGAVITTAGSGTATEILLYFTDNFTRYRELNADTAGLDSSGNFIQYGQVGYEFTPGDRLIILTNSSGAVIPFIDVAIIGQRGNAVVIQADSTLPILNGGENVIIYRPGLQDTSDGGRVYFEIPNASYAIIDPFGTPSWGTVSGILPGGDSYVIGTQIPVRPGFVQGSTSTPWSVVNVNRQSTSISDYYPSNVQSLGRAHSEDPLAKTELITTRVRFSDPWVKGSTYNGLCTFNALDFRDANPKHGTVRFMAMLKDRVVCLCEGSISFSLYLGSVTSRAGNGVLTAATGAVISQVYDFAVEYGTINPESCRKYKNWLFAFDWNKGVAYRVSDNGFDSITVYLIDHTIQDLTREYDGLNRPRVNMGVNEKFDEVWLSFEARQKVVNGIDVEVGNKTFVFHDGANRWISMCDGVPNLYSRTRSKLIGILGPRIFVHDSTPDAANIYGTQYPWGLRMVCNESSAMQKVWQAAGVHGTAGFRFTEYNTNEGQVALGGSVKRINGADYEATGIPRDQGGANKLRSKSITITMMNQDPAGGFIQAVSVRWTPDDPKP